MTSLEKLDEVIAYNQALIKQIKEINFKAGTEVIHVPTAREVEEFIISNLNGARNPDEIQDFESLKLRAIDPDIIAEVESLCPVSISIEGKVLEVKYTLLWTGKKQIQVFVPNEESEWVFSVNTEKIEFSVFRSEEKESATIYCCGKSATSFSELKTRLDSDYIELKKKEHAKENARKGMNPCGCEDILSELVGKIGRPIVIGNDRIGKEISITYMLKNDWERFFDYIPLIEGEEPITGNDLYRIYTAVCNKKFMVPEVSPFYIVGLEQPLYRKLEERRTTILEVLKEGLSIFNFDEKVKEYGEKLSQSEKEITNEYSELEDIVTSSIEKMEEVDEDFISIVSGTEIKIEKEVLREIEDHISEIRQIIRDLKFKDSRLKDLLYRAEFDLLREEILEVNNVFARFEKASSEYRIWYKETVNSLSRSFAQEISAMIFNSVQDEQSTVSESDDSVDMIKKEVVEEKVSFTEAAKRYFKCTCGYSNRMTKAEYSAYVSGKETEIACTGCKKTGTVKKVW